jgi:hypothetical protein
MSVFRSRIAHVAVGVLVAEVARPESAVHDGGRGRLGLGQAALEDVVAPDDHFSELARWQELDAVIDLGRRGLDLKPAALHPHS